MHVVGVDVGGTNTDAVLLRVQPGQPPQVVTTAKTVTSADVFSSMVHAVHQVINETEVTAVMLGTTHFVNALLQRRGLTKVCTLRLCGPATHAIPPMANWPEDLKETVDGLTLLVSGGYFFDGSEIRSLDENELRSGIRHALSLNICSFCVCGVFSPCRADQEERVGEIIREEAPTAYITLSHEIAGLGLSERENAAILNACLRPLASHTIGALQSALPSGIPLFLTKNIGTLLSAEESMRWPIFTFASGPTNSMIGAAYLSGVQNAIVIDVGGTSTDIGTIVDGRPRQVLANVRLVDDIRVNVGVPDVISLPLGGGTVIHIDELDGSIQVGPDSVGYRLDQEAMAFGGQTITGTDIALAAGLATSIGSCEVHLPMSIVQQVLDHVHQTVARGIDRMKTSPEPIPIILCGGGSILLDAHQSFPGVSQIIRPAHYAVCNAVGAALCSVSATVDSIVDLLPSSVDGGAQRQRELDRLIAVATQQCEQNGAQSDTIRLVELEQVPLAYHPGGHKHRVQVMTVGKLDLAKFKREEQEKERQNSVVQLNREAPNCIKPPVLVNLTNKTPIFDDQGAWCIDPIDIEYIAYGTGILGCGGGGESYHFKLWCLEALRDKQWQMRVLPPSSVRSSSDLVAAVAYMGAPTVSHELLPSGRECLLAVNAIETHLSKKITAIFSGEIGGANGLMGLLVAASKQVPCLDCDGMGRAFPRLDQLLPFIHDQPVQPASLCDVQGETVMCIDPSISTPAALEDKFREECTKRGLWVGICLPPMTGEQLQDNVLPHSLSRAWFLGQAKFNHRTQAIEAVARAGHGRVLISDGKVTNVERHTGGGFVRGFLTIETARRVLTIDFQNENLVARFDDGEILASVPDLITLVEQDSAEPLSTETVKYGYRVSVLVLPAPGPLTTPRALQSLGLEAFGYDYPHYKYVPSPVPIESVWDVFYSNDPQRD